MRKSAATNMFSHGLFASVCSELAEKKNEKITPTAVKTAIIDKQYMIARPVAFFRPDVSLPLLDEEVHRDRHHRPDARHHEREEPADGRRDQERDQPGLCLLGDLALDGRSVGCAATSRSRRRSLRETPRQRPALHLCELRRLSCATVEGFSSVAGRLRSVRLLLVLALRWRSKRMEPARPPLPAAARSAPRRESPLARYDYTSSRHRPDNVPGSAGFSCPVTGHREPLT